jgi:hypothetical protein
MESEKMELVEMSLQFESEVARLLEGGQVREAAPVAQAVGSLRSAMLLEDIRNVLQSWLEESPSG